jgi:myo-inositol catabolism protein IolC
MNVGFDQPLNGQAFDHRGSFQTKMFGWKGNLSEAQTAEIAATKQVIYDGLKAAVNAGVPKEKAGILLDEQFGAAILRAAAADGFIAWREKKIAREEAAAEVARRYQGFMDLFEKASAKR